MLAVEKRLWCKLWKCAVREAIDATGNGYRMTVGSEVYEQKDVSAFF